MASQTNMRPSKSLASYTIAWVAALSTGRAAAILLLDERHCRPKGFAQNESDENNYAWGRMGEHNIVITSLPPNDYGPISAAKMADGLRSSLPHIRIGLFVGIGAGIPQTGVVLGDVVVSSPEGVTGGVVQYDMYKALKEAGSDAVVRQKRGFLNSPSRLARNAVGALEAEHLAYPSKISNYLDVFQQSEQTRGSYEFPGLDKDPLRRNVVPPRITPKIHHGTIASGNILIENSATRDELVQWLKSYGINPLCFETEAAGLMDGFPCLVVLGISNYADEYKTDDWIGYAASTAAAYTKELLGVIEWEEVDETAQIGEVLDKVRQEISDLKHGSNVDSAMGREISILQAKLNILDGAVYNSYENEDMTECLQDTRTDILQRLLH